MTIRFITKFLEFCLTCMKTQLPTIWAINCQKDTIEGSVAQME